MAQVAAQASICLAEQDNAFVLAGRAQLESFTFEQLFRTWRLKQRSHRS